MAASCSESAARKTAMTSSTLKTSMPAERRWVGFSMSRAGLTGRPWVRRARSRIP
jgi:hypothetical protein